MQGSTHPLAWVGAIWLLFTAACGAPADELDRRVDSSDPHSLETELTSMTTDQPGGGTADRDDDTHPFQRRVRAPEFPRDAKWLNTAGPIRLADLRGKWVFIDFWTYCCINCMHVLPELKKLEKAYPNEVVVIGVHSAKFTTEEDADNISDAIVRYDIEHPVLVDSDHKVWQAYGARAWPTLRVIDPEGNLVAGESGEFQFETLDAFLKRYTPYYARKKLLDRSPVRFELLANRMKPTPLRFPGKILADETTSRLFISDSNHHRIVVASFDGRKLELIGSGRQGAADGAFEEAEFDHPQGCALLGTVLYVADTENHLIRKVDLKSRTVTTIAGTGVQARFPWPHPEGWRPGTVPKRWAGPPRRTALNSPWALWIHEDFLYIAMAGPHQIWRMPLDESEITPYAGNSREDIVDGRLLPNEPYAMADFGETPYSSFAQPSGLTSDGQRLFVADSEGSSIRSVPLDGKGLVSTIVGTAELAQARLFTFGDRDGPRERVLLQHPLGVAWFDGKLYVADTYNNKIKVIDPRTGSAQTLAGDGRSGSSDDPARFDEPAGIAAAGGRLFVADTNNHLIRVVDPASGKTTTLAIAGLHPPQNSSAPTQPDFSTADRRKIDGGSVRRIDGKLRLRVALDLPKGWKINQQGELLAWLTLPDDGPLDRTFAGRLDVPKGKSVFVIEIPAPSEGKDQFELALEYPYCSEGSEGLCRAASVVWRVEVRVDDDARARLLTVEHSPKIHAALDSLPLP